MWRVFCRNAGTARRGERQNNGCRQAPLVPAYRWPFDGRSQFVRVEPQRGEGLPGRRVTGCNLSTYCGNVGSANDPNIYPILLQTSPGKEP